MRKINNRHREFSDQEWFDFKVGLMDIGILFFLGMAAIFAAIYITGPWEF